MDRRVPQVLTSLQGNCLSHALQLPSVSMVSIKSALPFITLENPKGVINAVSCVNGNNELHQYTIIWNGN